MRNDQRKRKIESPKERQNRHKAMEAVKVLETIKHDFKEPPKAMEYFYDLYDRVHCRHEPLHDDRVKVGTMCIQVPSEIIHALSGAAVQRLLYRR